MQKNISDTPRLSTRQHNSPKPHCSPLIIIQGNFHLSKHFMERFYTFFSSLSTISFVEKMMPISNFLIYKVLNALFLSIKIYKDVNIKSEM